MKKTIILFLSLVLIAMPVSIAATTYTDVQNASVIETQDLSHAVARISTFKYTPKTSVINYNSAGIEISSISVINNTIDGFTLTVASAEGGVLHPATSADGEQDIPYGLDLTSTGTKGTGVNIYTTIASSDLSSSAADILTVASSQSTPTSLQIAVSVSLADVEDQMSMAGSYSDTLTFTYTDK
jgi:hypothetical protein